MEGLTQKLKLGELYRKDGEGGRKFLGCATEGDTSDAGNIRLMIRSKACLSLAGRMEETLHLALVR